MNVVRENRENQTALVKVAIVESDYMEAVDKKLKEYRRKANVPGFRPGMVPMGIINKMYRKGTIAETAYKVASDAAFDYIDKEKIDYMGDVLPSDEQKELDFDNNTEFEFAFELGLAPEVNLELSDKDKLTRYKIKVTDDMRNGFRTNFMRRFGQLVDVESVTEDEAVTGILDNGEIKTDDAYIGLISMSEEERKPYIGKKVGDELTVNVEELYKTPSQRASVLGVKEHELSGIATDFKFTITRIRKFAEPELNEEFFKTAFPGGEVTDAAGLDKHIESQIEAELDRESGYVFNVEVRKYLTEKANLTLPEDFLKRWLFTINEGKFSMEDIEKDFPAFLNMMRWNLIQKHLVEKLSVKIEQDDMLAEAKAHAAQQFAQYGMMNVGDEVLGNYAQTILGNKEEANKILDRLYEKKIIEAVTPLVKVSSKSVTTEEINKIFDKLNG
jgi:trigger factor